MNSMEELLKSMKMLCELLEDINIKEATNEQLLEYMELTNRLKAMILVNLA